MSRYASPSASSLSHREPNRAALLGAHADEDRYGSANNSGRASPSAFGGQGGAHYAQARTAEDLESQNEEQLEGLSAKVALLKNVRRPQPTL